MAFFLYCFPYIVIILPTIETEIVVALSCFKIAKSEGGRERERERLRKKERDRERERERYRERKRERERVRE